MQQSCADNGKVLAESGSDECAARRYVATMAIVLIVAVLAIDQWLQIRSLQGDLSTTADAWTEADTLRAAAGYAQLGFTANAGLPDLCFGNQFADQGTKKILRAGLDTYGSWEAGALAGRGDKVDGDHFIYTHYPPGPHWLAGLMTVTFGPAQVGLLRSLPVALGLIAILYLTWEMSRSLSTPVAAACLAIFACLPMFRNMMHGLSYQGYALALLLIELGLCLRLARNGWRVPGSIIALSVIGFIQGWLGFDYFFLVALAPVTVWMVERSSPSSWKLVALSCVGCAAGYALAHLLHFLQVVAYYGSTSAALHDFAAVAQYRSSGEALDGGQRMRPIRAVLWDYVTTHTAHPLHFNAPIMFFAACGTFALLLLRQVQPQRVSMLPLIAIPVALAISSCWVVFMAQHSAQHWHFIPRHYFLLVFVTVLAVCSALNQLRRLTREQFPVLWLAVLPTAVLAALVGQNSVLGPALAALIPLAAVESLAAYAFTAAVLLLSVRRLGIGWASILVYSPILYAAMIAPFIWARETLWSMSIAPPVFAPLRWAAVFPVAVIAGYGFLGVGWIVFRRLERNGYFALPAA